MTSVVLFQIDALNAAFQHLLSIQQDILAKKGILATQLASLKDTYTHLVKTNSKKIFLFCLDSFYFQYRILTIELDNINRFSSLINNRMYGDYFKLFQLMLSQMIDTHRHAFDTNVVYPPYKELEPFTEYKMGDIIRLHHDILRVLHFLHMQVSERQQHIQSYSAEINVGRSITSFLHTHEYENTLLREQLLLYVKYLEFFHTTQTKYMTKLFLYVDAFHQEIQEDILTNHASVRPASDSELNFETKPLPSLFDPSSIQLSQLETSILLEEMPPEPKQSLDPTFLESVAPQKEETPITTPDSQETSLVAQETTPVVQETTPDSQETSDTVKKRL